MFGLVVVLRIQKIEIVNCVSAMNCKGDEVHRYRYRELKLELSRKYLYHCSSPVSSELIVPTPENVPRLRLHPLLLGKL